MRMLNMTGAALLLLLLVVLGACSPSSDTSDAAKAMKAANLYIIMDTSASPGTMIDATLAQAAERYVSNVAAHMELGDSMTVYEAGARSSNRMVAHPTIATDYDLRIPTAVKTLDKQIEDIDAGFKRQGGDSSTNLLLTLETIHPDCTPRTTVILITDGIEDSEAVSASRALAAGTPVNLPAPAGKYLAGCRVVFLGIGITFDPSVGNAQLLPERELSALQLGWSNYLTSAGVQPKDVEFVSHL